MEYIDQYNTLEWGIKRLIILDRDKYRCQKCDSKRNLQVHHLKYQNDLKPWEYPDEYLTTLCYGCHNSLHDKTASGDLFLNNKKIKAASLPKAVYDSFRIELGMITEDELRPKEKFKNLTPSRKVAIIQQVIEEVFEQDWMRDVG